METCKVKFDSFEEMKDFCLLSSSLKSDVFLHKGAKICVDGKSLLGIYALKPFNELELEIVDRDYGETEEFIKSLKEMGVIIDEGN